MSDLLSLLGKSFVYRLKRASEISDFFPSQQQGTLISVIVSLPDSGIEPQFCFSDDCDSYYSLDHLEFMTLVPDTSSSPSSVVLARFPMFPRYQSQNSSQTASNRP